jgi:regulator of sigma E protease
LDIVTLAAWLSAEGLLSILMVVVGLGLVIFFHELGHFAVAKWCDVQVERFSIGFGPLLWSRKWGETEYALSAIPFGGYVKMLGQDDLDPGQETSGEIAENPRAYTAKSVRQRMAIISAGVIMNVITGLGFFVWAMRLGIQVQANEVGFVQPGMPAWEAGLEPDDRILEINGRPIKDFVDVTRGTALTTGVIRLRGQRADGREYTVEIQPDQSGTKRMIGVGPLLESLTLLEVPPGSKIPLTVPGSPAAEMASLLQPGDRIVRVGGEVVHSFADLRKVLMQRRHEALEFQLLRGPEANAITVEVTIPPQPYRWLGIRTEIGEIVGVQRDSPAAAAGMKRKDRLTKVQARLPGAEDAWGEVLEVGRDLDPARLPDWFADHAGRTVRVTLDREGKGRETRTVDLVPLDRRNWVVDHGPAAPLAIPAIGVVFQFVPRVLSVEPGSPAAQAGIKPNDLVTAAEFVKPDDWPEGLPDAPVRVDIGDKGWAHVLSLLQTRPAWRVSLTVRPGGHEPSRTVTLASVVHPDWYVASNRGLQLMPALQWRQAKTFLEACEMGWSQTRDSLTDVYLMLRGLLSRNISPKELHGPIGIFAMGVQVASAGFAQFLIFLGFLSVNLAVLNFLPIPVLDGGHMVFLIWEGITRRRPSERIYAAAMYAGLLFVLGLLGWVLYLDLMRRIAGS